MLSTGSEQQGQNIKARAVFRTLTKILDLLVFFHQVCKNSISDPAQTLDLLVFFIRYARIFYYIQSHEIQANIDDI